MNKHVLKIVKGYGPVVNFHETEIPEKPGQNQTLIPLALPWLTLASKLSACTEFTSLTSSTPGVELKRFR